MRSRYPDCAGCEAPCCRRQFMEDDEGYFTLKEIRPIYLEAGTDVRLVGWVSHKDGRQPMVACNAYDVRDHACTVYAKRPAHCREYDCRDDEFNLDHRTRAHCLWPRAD